MLYLPLNKEWIISKTYRRLIVLQNFKFKLNRTVLCQIYISLIWPILEYADIIWDSQSVFLKHRKESSQIEDAQIVTGDTRRTTIQKLYDETGWEILYDRSQNHKIVKDS